MVMMMTGRELPNTATKTAARAMPGKDMMMSRMRITTSETHLFETAAMEPKIAAQARAKRVAQIPMMSEMREP